MTKLLQSINSTAMGASALFVALALSGCGGTMAFQGEKAFNVSGHQPQPVAAPAPAPEPAPEKKLVNIRKNKIEIDEKIQFEHDKAAILPVSHGLLDEVVKVLKENTHVKKVLIEGHADADGDAKHNLTLSDDRAKAVMNYLVEHGIEKTRLTAKGYGSTKPIGDNATEAGKEKNRRVEFTIQDEKGAAK